MGVYHMKLNEKQFLQALRDLARLLGWMEYHTYDSRRSTAGFPDLVLVRNGRIIFAELKVNRNRPTPAQQAWMEALRSCPQVEVYLWTPQDWDGIVATLR